MVGTRKPRGSIQIIVYEDEEAFWVQRGKRGYAVLSYSYEGATQVAHRFFLEKGGEGKAVIIDLTEKEAA